MRQIGWAILFLLVVHLLAVGGFAAWLASTGRVSEERVRSVVRTFTHTVDDEKAKLAAEEEEAAKAKAMADDAAKLESLSHGPMTLADRLAQEGERDEVAMVRLERLRRETDDLRRQIERARGTIDAQKKQLADERAAFEAFVAETTTKLQQEDFQKAVEMYEQLKPKQAKAMLSQLMASGETDEVVKYLAAMQLRKASAVLKEFKTPAEIAQAAELVEQLRQRGVYDEEQEPALAGAQP